MKSNFSRRRFLATAGATAGATLVGKSLFDVSKVFATTPYVRPSVYGNMANLTSYANGVAAMKALSISSPTDPRGWTYQAAIHGSMMTGMPDWNTCQHNDDFFWSWHRMYLYWFERIVRSQSGDPSFSLPYWDWQTNGILPPNFRTPTLGNPLYTSLRHSWINNGTGSVDNPAGVLTSGVNSAFAQPIFGGASGAVELIQTPHGIVHVNVGGSMSSILTAATDPIFFLHHANVDRLWDLWLTQGGGQSDPTNDNTWDTTVFSFFDENGVAQNMTSCDVLRAANQLNYTYEGEPPQVNQYCGNAPLCTANYTTLFDNCIQKPPFYLRPNYGYGYYYFPVSYQLSQEIYGYLENPLNTLYLQHYGITCPTQPGVYWQVYVGLPIGSKPDIRSPYYVGSFAMYGAGVADQPPDGNEPATFSVPINTAIVAALKKLPKGGNIPITYSPTAMAGPNIGGPIQKSTLTIQQAQLTLQTVTQSGKAANKTRDEKVIANAGVHR